MKTISTRWIILGAAVGWLAAGTVSAETALERIKREGMLKVGVANEAPYGYITDDGQVTGEAPEIARQILAKLAPNVQLEGVATPFDALIKELNSGRFDLIAAGMFITPARCEQVVFTNPTYKVGEALAVKAGNPKNLTDFESIAANPNARLGVMAGAVEYGYAYEAGVFVDQVDLYPDYQEALAALEAGTVDAIGMTSLTVRDLVANANADIEATPSFFPVINGEPKTGYGAFALRKEDQALAELFNEQLMDFIGSEAHRATVEPFGFTPEMVPDKTAEELCRDDS